MLSRSLIVQVQFPPMIISCTLCTWLGRTIMMIIRVIFRMCNVQVKAAEACLFGQSNRPDCTRMDYIILFRARSYVRIKTVYIFCFNYFYLPRGHDRQFDRSNQINSKHHKCVGCRYTCKNHHIDVFRIVFEFKKPAINCRYVFL